MWADGLVELVQTLGQRARGVASDVSGLVVSGVETLPIVGGLIFLTGHLHRPKDQLIQVSGKQPGIES